VKSLVNQCNILNKHLDEIEIEMASLPFKDLVDEFTTLTNSRSSSQQRITNGDHLLSSLQRMDQSLTTEEGFTTPTLKKSITTNSMTTPTNCRSNQMINFDAYPNTPTIEQLGLSGAALELVKDSTDVNIKKKIPINSDKYLGSSDNELAIIMKSNHTSSSVTMASKKII
jgi:hypothetical protein